MWVSLKSRGRSPLMYTFVMLFLFCIVRAEHSRPFVISFGVFSSMLLVLQWITICLIAGGNSSFSPRNNKFSTLSPRIPQFNMSFPKNEFHTFVDLARPWINESPSNTVCIFLYLMLTYVVGVIYAISVYKIVQRRLMFANVSYIWAVRGHRLVCVSIWYSSLWSVALLSCFWCFNEIFNALNMEKNFEKIGKFKIKRKPLEKASFLGNHCSAKWW